MAGLYTQISQKTVAIKLNFIRPITEVATVACFFNHWWTHDCYSDQPDLSQRKHVNLVVMFPLGIKQPMSTFQIMKDPLNCFPMIKTECAQNYSSERQKIEYQIYLNINKLSVQSMLVEISIKSSSLPVSKCKQRELHFLLDTMWYEYPKHFLHFCIRKYACSIDDTINSCACASLPS